MCCGSCRRSACSRDRAASRRTRRRRACRCAASVRAASAARSCCSMACRSTSRSAAGCTGRACRSNRPSGLKWSTARARTCTATTRLAAPSTSARHGRRGRCSTSAAQYGNKNSPKLDFFGGDVWGKVGLLVDGSFFRSDGFPIVIENERGPRRRQVERRVQERQRQSELHGDAEHQRFRARRTFPRGSGQRQAQHVRRHRGRQQHHLEIRQRRRAHRPAGLERPAGDGLRQRRRLLQQFPRGAGRHARAQHRPHVAQPDRADERHRRHGAVVEVVLEATAAGRAPTGIG